MPEPLSDREIIALLLFGWTKDEYGYWFTPALLDENPDQPGEQRGEPINLPSIDSPDFLALIKAALEVRRTPEGQAFLWTSRWDGYDFSFTLSGEIHEYGGTENAAAVKAVMILIGATKMPPKNDNPIPTPLEFLPFIDKALAALRERLRVGGKKYGEEVLFSLGEIGAVSLTYTKAARALWSLQQGHPAQERKDTWLDLAGYAVLEMARNAYESGEEIDGLFDRKSSLGAKICTYCEDKRVHCPVCGGNEAVCQYCGDDSGGCGGISTTPLTPKIASEDYRSICGDTCHVYPKLTPLGCSTCSRRPIRECGHCGSREHSPDCPVCTRNA